MRHDATIPFALHTQERDAVKDALGVFWSSIFQDQDLVDAVVTARVLAASQFYIDAMETLSLRDHTGSPVFHREHWHPMLIRYSQRNTGSGLFIGMPDTPQIGPQTAEDTVYLEGEEFSIGGNAEYSKVNTYPIDGQMARKLVQAKTCICDAIAAPTHILTQGRDFDIRDGILIIRKEHDPFSTSGYRIIADEEDRIAVLWVCDALLDTNNVGDFLAYPLGFSIESTPAASAMLSAIWDVVIYGVTPRYLNIALGAVFGVPVIREDTQVERVTSENGMSTVVTTDSVYQIPTDNLRDDIVVPGAKLVAGDFITRDITVYHGLSKAEVGSLVADGKLCNLSLPPGSVSGVDTTVYMENRSSIKEPGAWFKLNDVDSTSSDFWRAVFSRTTEAERDLIFSHLSCGTDTVNPLLSIGYTVLTNMILVRTTRGLLPEPYVGQVFDFLRKLVPSAASLLVISAVDVSEVDTPITMADEVVHSTAIKPFGVGSEQVASAADEVVFTFIPDTVTEV